MMDKQEFDNKRKKLTTIQKVDFEYFLKSKSDDEIAEIRGVDRSTVNRNITNIATAFGIKRDKLINDSGRDGTEKIVHRQKLLKLCLRHISDEVTKPHIYDESGDNKSDDDPASVSENIVNTDDRPQPLTNPQNIPTPESITELTTLEFIGREKDLINLASLRRQYKLVLIKSGAGVGKSTLAREFLQTQFKKVIRIEMGLESGNVTPAEEKVSQILRKDFDEEPSRDFGINLDILREKLADRANPIGVLIDNLEPALDENYRFREKLRGYDALLAVLGDLDVCSFTLITSRRSLIAQRVKVHAYSLEGLDITAWRQYFHDCEHGVDSEALLQMCVAYNGNAKVMDILHGAIKNRFDGNIGAYWSRYKDALLADSELETLISVEMDWLRDNQPDAYKLLCRMGCYRYQDVKTVPFEGLICLLWDVPDFLRSGVIEFLSKSSLNEAKGEYYLHPAIREAAKLRLLRNEIDWRMANYKIAEFWTDRIKVIETVDEALTAFESYYHYCEIKDFSLAGGVLVKMRKNRWDNGEKLCKSLYRLGFLQKTIDAIESIKEVTDSVYILTHIYNTLGDLYWLTGKIHPAIECHQMSSNFAKQVLKQDDSSSDMIFWTKRLVWHSLFNQGLCYIEIMELDEAFRAFQYLHQEILTIAEHGNYVENGRFPNEVMNNIVSTLALICSKIGMSHEAISLADLCYETVLMPSYDSWTQGYSRLFLGMTYQTLGDSRKAEFMFNNAIKYARESNYRQVEGKAINGLAEMYRQKEDFQNAVLSHLSSIEILNKIGAVCDLAEAYFQLGLTYQAMGEHNQAEEYKAKALEFFAQMEAPKQIERVNKAFGGNIQ